MSKEELIERIKALVYEAHGSEDLHYATSVLCTLAASLIDGSDDRLSRLTVEHSKAQSRAYDARLN